MDIKKAWELSVARSTLKGSSIAHLSERATPKPTPICINRMRPYLPHEHAATESECRLYTPDGRQPLLCF